ASFAVADAQALPFDDESFDYVFSFECLEHVPSPQKMLDEIFRVLKKGGKIYLTTENYSNAYAYYILFLKLTGKKFDSGSGAQPIENFFVYWRVKRKFKNAGFADVKVYGKQYVPLLLPGLSPSTFTIQSVKSSFLQRILKPLSRRVTFFATKKQPSI
ncbi:MAG: methyltransferase domain-containing protein, partial [Bacteroidota bacterium]